MANLLFFTFAAGSLLAQNGAEYRSFSGRLEQHVRQTPGTQIIVRMPSAHYVGDGQLRVRPNVDVTQQPTLAHPYARPSSASGTGNERFIEYVQPMPSFEELPPSREIPVLPVPSAETPYDAPVEVFEEQPIFEQIVGSAEPRRGPLDWLRGFNPYLSEVGLGRERLLNAIFEMDSPQPLPSFRARVEHLDNVVFPDRSEFFWSRVAGGRGPALPEVSVDTTDIRLAMELGSENFSVTTEVPLRWMDPLVNANHAGIGDVNLKTKTVFLRGKSWLITQYFGASFNTGAPSHGLGSGHIALEPGFLFSYRWSDLTRLFSEIKYLFPLGSDPNHSGQVLRYGFGLSHLLYEDDVFSLIPTFEIVHTTFLNGQKTGPLGLVFDADGDHVINVFPGLRVTHDRNSELGLFEFGINSGVSLSTEMTFNSLTRVELRWSF